MADEPPGSFTFMTGNQLQSLTPQQRQKIVSRQLIVPSGELLSMTADEAVTYGFARRTLTGPNDLYKALGLKPDQVRRVYPSAGERLVAFLNPFTPLLIVAGFVLLFLELLHPGFGLPGILGIACFVLFFVIKVSLHYAGALEVLLFVIGLALLLVEIFLIPGFGITGITGLVLMFAGLVLAFQRFDLPRTPEEWVVLQYNVLTVIASLAASAIGIGLMVRLVPSMPGLRRVMNVHNESQAHIGDLQESRTPGLSHMIGDVGVAVTPLRPAGRADFGSHRLDVVTRGDFIERGQRVRIEAVHGNRIIVGLYREP
jgi:membrane-bound serine protease (ClpP class)